MTSIPRSRLHRPFGCRSQRHSSVCGLLAIIGLSLLPACNDSSGSGGDFRIESSVFGFESDTGNFTSVGAFGESPVLPQNMCLIFRFSNTIDPRTVSSESITVQEVEINGNDVAPGPDAAVSFTVRGSELVICPLISLSDNNVAFGFAPNRAYQVLFQIPPSPTVVRGSNGRPLSSLDRGPFLIRTSDQIFDRVPGPPEPIVSVVDRVSRQSLGFTGTPFKPVPDIQILFNEPIIPSTALSDSVAGTSGSMHVQLEQDGDLETSADRITIPGRFRLTQTEDAATVTWSSLLTEIPTGPSGRTYVVRIDGTVADLAGNSKILQQSDPTAGDSFVFTTAAGPASGPADERLEEFSNQDLLDLVSSARWGSTIIGLLTPGAGGGSGSDGVFDPNDPSFPATSIADQVTVDDVESTIWIDTEDQANPGSPRTYQFLSFELPVGWTVRPTGPFPLDLQVSGDVTVRGTLDASGEDAEVFALGQVRGGAAGTGAAGGLSGAAGGGLNNADGASTLFPGELAAFPTHDQLGFQLENSAVEGVSGRATAVTDFSITDANLAVDLALLFPDLEHVYLQPNVAADDERFTENHAVFKVASISGGLGNQVIAIVSDTSDPYYRGPLTAVTSNAGSPVLGELGDAYVIGQLEGETGGSLFDLNLDGNRNAVLSACGGEGSRPITVMQANPTLARSGGAGGGGSFFPGEEGVDDTAGSSGGRGGDGAPLLTVAAFGARTITFLETPFDDGTGAINPNFEGHLINPQIGQGLTFFIDKVTTTSSCEIVPLITLGGDEIDLLRVPSLIANATARLTPPFTVGGAGGGGAGVHCTTSPKDAKSQQGYDPASDPNPGVADVDFFDDDDANQLEDTSEQIFPLPIWTPGGGGGAGGGVIRMAVGGSVVVTSTGEILAEGGDGGGSDGDGERVASGGGGGAGGNISIGAGNTVAVSVGGLISVSGGAGGGENGNQGGRGGSGRIRIENQDGDLTAAEFAGATIPFMTAEHLGIFPGGGNSIGQSQFFAAGVLVPSYGRITVRYSFQQGANTVNGATYIVHPDGTVDPSSTLNSPPFGLTLNFTKANAATGLPINPPPEEFEDFVDPRLQPLQLFDGLEFVRFRFTFDDPSNPQFGQTDVRIDSIEMEVNSISP